MRLLGLLLLTLFITSCAHLTPPATTTLTPTKQTTSSWESRKQILSRIEHWQVNGKIGVQTARDAGSATVDWVQRNNQYSISLLGPLGANALQLNGGPDGVTLTNAKGKQIHAAEPEQLLAQQWGFHVPVSHLKYWVRGLPVANLPAQTHFDTVNRLTDLAQQGWRVQFLSYMNVDGIDLPSKIAITSPSLRVKMIIYHWKLS